MMFLSYMLSRGSFYLNTSHPLFLFALYALVYVAVLILAYRSAKPQGGHRIKSILSGMRLVAVLLVFFFLMNPSTIATKPHSTTERIVLMLDTSRSMSIRDETGGKSRFDRMQEILDGSRLEHNLAEIFPLAKYGFDTGANAVENVSSLKPEGDSTHLIPMLKKVALDTGELRSRAVVVMTDGADTSESDFLEAIRELNRRNVAVYPVAYGSDELRRDIAIDKVRVSKNVARDTEASIDVFLEQNGFDNTLLAVKLMRGDETVETSGVLLDGPAAKTTLKFTPKVEGLHTLRVVAELQKGEAFEENNSQVFSVNSVKSKLNILYMEGTMYKIPTRDLWEYQYLEQAVRETPDMEIKSLFRDPTKEAYLAGVSWVQDPVNGFPTSKRELFKYDIIISSDIDLIYFTEEQLEWTVEFVEKHGGGYIMIGGWTSYGSGGYDESVIDRMLPVDMQGRADGYFEGSSFKMIVTPEGRKHPIFQISGENNDAILDAIPFFRGCNRVQRAKPGAVTIAEHPYYQTAFGPMPLIAVQEYGRGRTMAFVSDTTAGWGELFESDWGEDGDNRYYRRFWQNAFRWLGQYRLARPSKYVLIETDKANFGTDEEILLTVEVNDENFEPTGDATVRVNIFDPAGKRTTITLSPDPRRTGKYTGSFSPDAEGRYEAEAVAYLEGTQLDTDVVRIEVAKPNVEFSNYLRNDHLLERLARFTGGKMMRPGEVHELPDIIREAQGISLESLTEVRSVWDKWYFLIILFSILTVEWVVRKRSGLA